MYLDLGLDCVIYSSSEPAYMSENFFEQLVIRFVSKSRDHLWLFFVVHECASLNLVVLVFQVTLHQWPLPDLPYDSLSHYSNSLSCSLSTLVMFICSISSFPLVRCSHPELKDSPMSLTAPVTYGKGYFA